MNNILKHYGFCVLTLLSICLTCRAGEDYGGTANLCADIYIRKPDGSKGYFEIQNRKIKDNRYYIITESGGKQRPDYMLFVISILTERRFSAVAIRAR